MVEVQKTIDSWFVKIQKSVGTGIGHFVAFFFFSITIGAFIGIMVMQNYPGQAMLAIIMPALAGALAYYNRTFAVVVFIFMLLLVFIF